MSDQTPYRCPRCLADPQPAIFRDPRGCLFLADGTFNPGNWNCATEVALFEALEHSRYAQETTYGNNESLDVVPAFPPRTDDPDDLTEGAYGWLIFTRYKHRGRTSAVVWVGDFPAGRNPVTLELIEATIAALSVRRKNRR